MKRYLIQTLSLNLPIAGVLTALIVLSIAGCSGGDAEAKTSEQTKQSENHEPTASTESGDDDHRDKVAAIKKVAHSLTLMNDEEPTLKQAEPVVIDESDASVDRSADASSNGETRRHAVLIGVSEYPEEFPPLPGAVRDITELSKVLISKGFDKENLTVLTNAVGSQDARNLPLAYNIRRKLKQAAKNCGSQDALVVAMAGHGIQPTGGKYYFCPYDAELNDLETLISIEEVYQLLESSPAKFKLLLIDACREETGDGSNSESRPSQKMSGLPAPPQGMATFVSCSQGQLAYERQDGELSHGVFFHAVISGLSGAAMAEDGTITVPDLERYVKRKVESYVRDTYQAEQIPVLRNNTAGLFSIIKYTRNDEQLEKFRWCLCRDKYEEAGSIIESILKQSPRHGVALAERSRWMTYRMEQMGDESQMDVALEDARLAIELAPNESMPYVAMANVLRMKKEYEQALAFCTQALERDPNNIQAHIIKGMTQYGLRDFKSMYTEAQAALEIDPTHPEARGLYGAFLFADGKYDEGHAELDRAIALMPDIPTLYFLKGYGYEQQGKHHDAVNQYSSAIRLNDQVPSYLVRRSLSLGNSGDYPSAWKDVEAAEKLNPTYYDVTSAKAMLLVNQQKWQEALVELNKGLKQNPDSTDLLMGRGFAYVYTQQFDKGEVDLQRMVELNPESAQGHLGLAFIDFHKDRLDDANTHIQRAIRFDDRSSEAHYVHAALFMKRKQFKEAIPPLSRAIELDPKNAVYYQQRAMLYQAIGRYSESQSDNATFQRLQAQ